ncbi:hypothetical protein DY000_02016997 [Brassica cretica]|uniref:Yippee domain-containing protein n=1 Tax=Brassica cretica TaxID=69181 RepID=A0ABQ7DA78_BRACR|nr:hypothetical protein DY000_02016997 [Brassica cretica]
MGRIFTVELEGRSYRCRFCRTHLALPDDLISKHIATWKVRYLVEFFVEALYIGFLV